MPNSASSLSNVGQKSWPTPVSTSCVMIAHDLYDFGQYQMKGISFSLEFFRISIQSHSMSFSTVVSTGHSGNEIFDQSCNAILCKYFLMPTGINGRIA